MNRNSLKRQLLILALILVSAIHAQVNNGDEFDQLVRKKFEKFITKYNKVYSSEKEMEEKYQIFKRNYLDAKQKDIEVNSTEEGKLFGTTMFMDLTPEEFSARYLTLNTTSLPDEAEMKENTVEKAHQQKSEEETSEGSLRFLQQPINNDEVPESWDWRQHGAVTPVRNQGVCGGCWAFAAVSNIESQVFLKYGKLTSYSEQQLVDCDPYNSGCLGGIMHNAYTYIKYWGLQKRSSYPYEFTRGQCRYNAQKVKVPVNSYLWAGTDDEEKIKEYLYRYGPFAITINARLLQYYYGGVINVNYAYCPYAPNHGVNLVGYGKTALGLKYWIVRNTWGPQWGEGGYFRIARGRGLCGVNKYVITAVIN